MLAMTLGMDLEEENETIRKAGKKISVYPYEIKLWMVSYQIIKKVQAFEQECKREGAYIRTENKMDIIRRELLGYMQENIGEKRYRVIKILNHVFRVLEMSESKTKYWLRKFIEENREQLAGLDF